MRRGKEFRPWHVQIKEFVFDYYLYLGLSCAAVAEFLVISRGPGHRLAFSATVLGGLLGFFYFIQQQRLSELDLFRAVFMDFNARYEKLNQNLEEIADSKAASWDDPSTQKTLEEYFNLCAEEYFYYRRGLIPQEVWQAWSNGIEWWAKKSPFIRGEWVRELGTDSYYRFPTELIAQAGAHEEA